ncbi:MAG: IPT/TIG domain-containing protein [Holophaga sp.]|nr:IPT/TIG domain-containing protein [Holophaga sp.]
MTRKPSLSPKHRLSVLTALALLVSLGCGGRGSGSGLTTAQTPVIATSNLSGGQPNTKLVLSGTGFTDVQQVWFGQTPAVDFDPSADGTQLTVTIPAGTGTVTLTVTTSAGTSPVGPSFTFQQVPPAVTAFTPGTGEPGTKVVFKGTNLNTSLQVTFGGVNAVTLPSADGTQLTAWVPDQLGLGQANVAVGPAQPAGSPALLEGQFTVLGRRLDTLGGALVPVADLDPDYYGKEFDFPSAGQRTAQYQQYSLPKAPILHPYNPGLDVRPEIFTGIPKFTLNIKYPQAFSTALPDSVAAQVQAAGIDPGKLDIFVESQDQIWTGVPMLFRPHYWTDPDAPNIGIYSTASRITVGLFEAENGVVFTGHPVNDFFSDPSDISVHSTDPAVASQVLSSPNNYPVSGLDSGTSTSFWSLVVKGNQAAATLHLLLNDADQAALESLFTGSTLTIGQLGQALQGLTLSNPRMVTQSRALFRPVITGAILGSASQGGDPTLTILGSGFTGATGVTVGSANQAAAALTVVSDTVITVTIPQAVAAQGNIIVTSAFGASRPAALN